MSVDHSKFAKLMDLAKETSSEKRRDLLREVTDVFLQDETAERSEAECAMFDEIIGAVATDMTEQVRMELSRKVAVSKSPLRKTARRLATDSIRVAEPVLRKSTALTDEDLVHIVNTTGQDRLMAVSKREKLGSTVSAALVNKGEDKVVVSLLENETAEIDRETYEVVTERAMTSKVLQAPLVRRKNVPLDLLNNVYHVVEKKLRDQIMARFDSVSEAELNAALEASRHRLNVAYGKEPEDMDKQKKWVEAEIEANRLTPPHLVQQLRNGERARFFASFAYFTHVPLDTVYRIIDQKDVDAMAILCRAAHFPKALFSTLAMQIVGGENGVAKAKEYSDMYEQVPLAAAQRAVRFWKVRSSAAKAA
ncbi:DUF2336 domain-containing protein [Hirschia litorea]|uniref:DUF2336 domain-containing protein n=1 Tax=Hirschia litorea TaxID=1199156 RepID=A0ABW2IIH9_9PROT